MNVFDNLNPFSPQNKLNRAVARKKLNAITNSGYSHHGASKSKKSLLGWISKGLSPDEDIVENLSTLRERSRDLYMGTPIATGALKTIRTNVVGAGLKLNPRIDYEFLGMTLEQAEEWEKQVEREWKLWANSKECDAARMLTFGQIQSVTMLSVLMSGDVFAMLPVKKRKCSVYDLRVSLIEGDRVADPKMKPELPKGQKLSGGIVTDQYGEALKCYIYPGHPDSRKNTNQKPVSVDMFGKQTGRPNVLHVVSEIERPGQLRCVPLLAPVIESLKQLGRYTEAELMAAVVSGMFTVFIKSESPENPLQSVIPEEERLDDMDESSYELGNGAIIGLDKDESIETANPGRPNTAFDGFVTSICRQIGSALEVPYELLIKHFTASYSASRGALLEAWKMFRMRRQWLVESFCQPIYEEWLAEAIAKGRIAAPGFFNDPTVRAAWSGSEWYGPTQGQLDPLKEANAAKVRVNEEFSTRTREAAELTGEDWDRVHKLRTREENKRREDNTYFGDAVKVAEVMEGEQDA
ncbi:MAG: phage portal protein [Halomonas sp.]|nr:phage portal protein [Halomonas sp.]